MTIHNDFLNCIRWIVFRESAPTSIQLQAIESNADLIFFHDLTSRVKQASNKFCISFSSKKIATRIEHNVHITKQLVFSNILAVSNLITQLGWHNQLILIKGAATYLLSNDESTIRSGDVDILCVDYNELIAVLKKLEYQETRKPFMHELGEYTKDIVEIDIHKYFPIYRYSSLKHKVLYHNGTTTKYYNAPTMSYTPIDIELLTKYSLICHPITVANPSILCIITAAHLFQNYVNLWSISHRKKPYIKLSELADIIVLMEHHAFDNNQFHDLVNLLNAQDCITFVTTLIYHIFNKKIKCLENFKILPLKNFHNKFPRAVWWGILLPLKMDIIKSLAKDWYPIDDIISIIGINQTHPGVVYSPGNGNKQHSITNFLYQHSYNFLESISISAKTNIKFNVFITQETTLLSIRLDSHIDGTEITYNIRDDRVDIVGNPLIVSKSASNSLISFNISELPRNKFLSTQFNIGILIQELDNEISSIYFNVKLNKQMR